ncbi:hypothetical protein [Pararhodobacter oceanensis]|uniref:hypothetical protein n=1 Tax=Pararhodobacter oceanensis TaxID=2172121 RepID=UPI003A8EF02A
MRNGQGIVGATLLFGPNDPPPDLVASMQFLVDDLRSDGHRISGLRLGARSMRLRADQFELALTIADTPIPEHAMAQLFRPAALYSDEERPDFSKVHLLRNLRGHSHALGFLLRRRGPPLADELEAEQELVRKGRLCLLPVIEAAPPLLMIWQPGGLLLSKTEFIRADPDILRRGAPPGQPLLITGANRARAARPGLTTQPIRLPPQSRSARAEGRSGGRVFGSHQPQRPKVLPRLEGADSEVVAALRAPVIAPDAPRRGRLGLFVAVAVLGLFLPQVLGQWLPL